MKQKMYEGYKAIKKYEASHTLLETSLKLFRDTFHASDLHQKRRFQAFCLGTPRSGTHSIANLLGANYRSHHEPGIEELSQKIIQARDTNKAKSNFHKWLRIRDLEFYLEMEASHPLNHIVKDLSELFPDAKFILTIRDCYSWLNSEVNKNLESRKTFWRQLEDFRYKVNHFEYNSALIIVSATGAFKRHLRDRA